MNSRSSLPYEPRISLLLSCPSCFLILGSRKIEVYLRQGSNRTEETAFATTFFQGQPPHKIAAALTFSHRLSQAIFNFSFLLLQSGSLCVVLFLSFVLNTGSEGNVLSSSGAYRRLLIEIPSFASNTTIRISRHLFHQRGGTRVGFSQYVSMTSSAQF